MIFWKCKLQSPDTMHAYILIIQAFSIDYYFLRVLKSYRSLHFHNHLFNHWIVDIFTPLMTPTKRCFSVKPLINIFSTCSTHQEHFTIMLVKWFNKMQVPGSLHWTILAYSHSVIYPCLRKLCLHLRMEFMEVFHITCHWGISCGMWHFLIQCLSVGLWSFSAWPIHWNFIKEKYGIEYKLSGFANLIC